MPGAATTRRLRDVGTPRAGNARRALAVGANAPPRSRRRPSRLSRCRRGAPRLSHRRASFWKCSAPASSTLARRSSQARSRNGMPARVPRGNAFPRRRRSTRGGVPANAAGSPTRSTRTRARAKRRRSSRGRSGGRRRRAVWRHARAAPPRRRTLSHARSRRVVPRSTKFRLAEVLGEFGRERSRSAQTRAPASSVGTTGRRARRARACAPRTRSPSGSRPAGLKRLARTRSAGATPPRGAPPRPDRRAVGGPQRRPATPRRRATPTPPRGKSASPLGRERRGVVEDARVVGRSRRRGGAGRGVTAIESNGVGTRTRLVARLSVRPSRCRRRLRRLLGRPPTRRVVVVRPTTRVFCFSLFGHTRILSGPARFGIDAFLRSRCLPPFSPSSSSEAPSSWTA